MWKENFCGDIIWTNGIQLVEIENLIKQARFMENELAVCKKYLHISIFIITILKKKTGNL